MKLDDARTVIGELRREEMPVYAERVGCLSGESTTATERNVFIDRNGLDPVHRDDVFSVEQVVTLDVGVYVVVRPDDEEPLRNVVLLVLY